MPRREKALQSTAITGQQLLRQKDDLTFSTQEHLLFAQKIEIFRNFQHTRQQQSKSFIMKTMGAM